MGEDFRAAEQRLSHLMADELPQGMAKHTNRVVTLANTLAERHRLNAPLARLMAQGHDLVRHVPPAELLARAEARGLAIDPVEREAAVILHGPIGAIELMERMDINEPDVLFAIRWHTTGHPSYTPEAWAMFVADKVEPRKVRRWPALEEVRNLADHSLEQAALRYLDLRLDEAIRDGLQVHPMATLTRNHLLRELK